MYYDINNQQTFLICPYPSYDRKTLKDKPDIIRVNFIPKITPKNILKKFPTILTFSWAT